MIIKNSTISGIINFLYIMIPSFILLLFNFNVLIYIGIFFINIPIALISALSLKQGITLWPFILLFTKETDSLINHERIHLKQQFELGVIFFFIWYMVDFLIKYIKHKKYFPAYKDIIFEREAFEEQNNLNYLKNRPLWNFKKY